MPLNLTPEKLLEKAEEQEKKYGWLYAVWSYEQAMHVASENEPFIAEIWRRIGFCYERASRQVNNLEEFKTLRQQAVEAYQEAAKLFKKIKGTINVGKSEQNNALAAYTRSWLAASPSEKETKLEECLKSGVKALKTFQSVGDKLNYGKMCNDLFFCLFDRLFLSSNDKDKTSRCQQGIYYANEAISALLKLDDKSELLRAYSIGSLQSWYFANICALEEKKKELAELSISYSKKALALSKEIDNLYDKALSRWAASLSNLAFTGNITSAIEYAKEMLQQGTVVNDNYLKGVASYLLAYTTDWTIPREANPDKKRERCKETIKYAEDAESNLLLVAQDSIIAEAYLFSGQSYASLAEESVESSKKIEFSKKALEVGRKGLKYAVNSGSPDAIGSTLHALSKALQFNANLEPRIDEKKKLLKEALDHRKEYNNIVERAFPSMDWVLGVGKVYTAQIEADLTKLEKDIDIKRSRLEQSIKYMDEGVLNCKKWIASGATPSIISIVAEFEDSFGQILQTHYLLNNDERILRKANGVYIDAAKRFKEVALTSRVAESYWKIARNQDRLSDEISAARNYYKAHIEYTNVAEEMPSFSQFFTEYALYMKAWSEIEKAKSAHEKKQYSRAMKHYASTANLLKETKGWDYLSSNFLAWSTLEKAESLSRNDKSVESSETFKEAAELFRDAKTSLEIVVDKIDDQDEQYLVERLIEASDMRAEYCFGRVAIEEAKTLDRQGEHMAGAKKYGSAAIIFQTIANSASEQNSRELYPIIYLCRAWQKMMIAEAKSSSSLYGEAAKLFETAQEHSIDESSSSLALAHSNFCRAMEVGTEFELTRDLKLFSAAKKYMDVAAGYYAKSGLQSAAEYANGTQRLFDAYILMDTAKDELDPDKKAKYFRMAEKVLQFSVESFKRAKHPDKIKQTQQILARIKEEKELAGMLSDILHAPTIVSSTASFATLTPREENAVGLESFERANIQATLLPQIQQVKTGDNLTLEIHIVNVGKEAVLLTSLNDIVPINFKLVDKPEYSDFKDPIINLKGKRLNPLQTEEFKLVLNSSEEGSYKVKPKITYVDEAGNNLLYEPDPITIELSEGFPSRIATGYTPLDKLLIGGIPENYPVVLTSPFCDERDILIKRFLRTGIEKNGIVIHLTVNQTESVHLAEENQSNFFLFICNPQAGNTVKDLPNIFKLKGVEKLTDITIALTKALRTLEDTEGLPKRVCIEIVSDVLLQHKPVQTRRWLTELITDLKARGFTTLAVVNPLMHPIQDVQAILGLFEGEIVLEDRKTDEGSQKFLKVKRLYNQIYLESELPLKKEKVERLLETSEGFPSRIATGYTPLDKLLIGGIPENYPVVLTSPFCDERDILIKRFLEEGTKEGAFTFYVCTEVSGMEIIAEKFQSIFYIFVCNPRADLMIKDSPNVIKLKRGVSNLTDINISLTSIFRKINETSIDKKRICLSIISDVLLQHQAITTKRWLTELITDLKARGFTTLAVVNPLMHPIQDVQAILGLFEGEIVLEDRKTDEGSQKFLKVKRMYNQNYLKNELLLKKESL